MFMYMVRRVFYRGEMSVYVHGMTCVLQRRHECLCTWYDVCSTEET